jgi:hypothetical protein
MTDYRHCTNERCRWYREGIAHVGPCYDGRSPAKVQADEALAESRQRQTHEDRVVDAIKGAGRTYESNPLDPVGHPDDWTGHA